jgi:hypothetical protein
VDEASSLLVCGSSRVGQSSHKTATKLAEFGGDRTKTLRLAVNYVQVCCLFEFSPEPLLLIMSHRIVYAYLSIPGVNEHRDILKKIISANYI